MRRDKRRGNTISTYEDYKIEIHRAVSESGGIDCYTEEQLDWSLMNTYDNDKSKKGGREYKKSFAILPSIDHVEDGKGQPNFKICAWRTNNAKNDLNYGEFINLCNSRQ